jgi:hypothetical protein
MQVLGHGCQGLYHWATPLALEVLGLFKYILANFFMDLDYTLLFKNSFA